MREASEDIGLIAFSRTVAIGDLMSEDRSEFKNRISEHW
jgi:hypothetical protein